MAVTGMEIVEATRQFAGAPYNYWTGAVPEYGPPGYGDWQNPGYYSSGYVWSEGVHCAGLVNLARMECGLAPIGLTKQYAAWLWASGIGEYFNPDPNAPGVPGAICVRPWDPYTGAEGHVAIYTDAHTLIQAVLNPGVYEGEQDYDSYTWAGYNSYSLMPDVDYSDVRGWDNTNQEEVWYDAGWKWHAPGSSPPSNDQMKVDTTSNTY